MWKAISTIHEAIQECELEFDSIHGHFTNTFTSTSMNMNISQHEHDHEHVHEQEHDSNTNTFKAMSMAHFHISRVCRCFSEQLAHHMLLEYDAKKAGAT